MKLSEALLEAGVSLGSVTDSTPNKAVLWGVEAQRDDKDTYEALLKKSDIFLIAPMEDRQFNNFIKYEAGTEEGVLALLSKALCEIKKDDTSKFLQDLDDGYISAETNVGEEEAEKLANWLNQDESVWVFGAEWENHPKAKSLALWLAFIAKRVPVSFVIIGVEAEMAASRRALMPETDVELESFDGTIMYACLALEKDEENMVFASPQFAIAAKAKDGDEVYVQTAWGDYTRSLHIDKNMKGTIALLPFANLPEGYRYAKSRISPVG